MNKWFIYLARLLSACCFYLFLAKANTWLDTSNNTIMAFGYRFFILLAPLIFFFANKKTAFFAFLAGMFGIICWINEFYLIGTIILSSGMAVGGYVLKYHASKTPEGAANNRVALNMGVFLSGLMLLLPFNNNTLLWIGLMMMLVTLISSIFIDNSSDEIKIQKKNFSFSQLNSVKGIAWAIVGLVTGIKLMSTMSILPQYLIYTAGKLPNWFGLIISISSLCVVLLQIPIMQVMKRNDFYLPFIILFFSMVMIALPSLFYCETLAGGMLWTFVLTMFECGVMYLDTFSVKDGTLLIKEFFVGIGMALTVLLMRYFDAKTGALLLGGIGIFATIIAVQLFRPAMISGKVMET